MSKSFFRLINLILKIPLLKAGESRYFRHFSFPVCCFSLIQSAIGVCYRINGLFPEKLKRALLLLLSMTERVCY